MRGVSSLISSQVGDFLGAEWVGQEQIPSIAGEAQRSWESPTESLRGDSALLLLLQS